MISPPIMRVDTPQEVVHAIALAPSAPWKEMSNALAKFWPSSWLVPICNALPSRIIASTVRVLVAPGKRSWGILRPRNTGMARYSSMKSAYTS